MKAKCLQRPEDAPAEDPWPEFIRQVLLSPAAGDETELELLIEIEPGATFFPWSAKRASKDSIPDETLAQMEKADGATS